MGVCVCVWVCLCVYVCGCICVCVCGCMCRCLCVSMKFAAADVRPDAPLCSRFSMCVCARVGLCVSVCVCTVCCSTTHNSFTSFKRMPSLAACVEANVVNVTTTGSAHVVGTVEYLQ